MYQSNQVTEDIETKLYESAERERIALHTEVLFGNVDVAFHVLPFSDSLVAAQNQHVFTLSRSELQTEMTS